MLSTMNSDASVWDDDTKTRNYNKYKIWYYGSNGLDVHKPTSIVEIANGDVIQHVRHFFTSIIYYLLQK